MKRLFLFFLIIYSVNLFAQTKYLIYFIDKGFEQNKSLLKGTQEYNSAIELLSPKSIQRRLKTRSEDSLVTYEDLPIRQDYINQLESIGIKIQNKLKWFNAVTAYLTNQQFFQLHNLDFVEKIKPVKILEFSPYKFQQFEFIQKEKQLYSIFDYGPSYDQLQLSDIPVVHSHGITGQGVLLGLLDTGFDWKTHESLQSRNVMAEYDFVFGDSITANGPEDNPDQDSHGTYVFSIVGGYKDSSMIGASFGANFILAKTEDIRTETHIEEDNYAAALEWMENYGVDITSSSLGYNIFDTSTYSYTYEDMNGVTTIITRACEIAYRNGVTTVTAAGNEGGTNWYYIIAPADGINTLAIGAVDANKNVAGFSSRGPTYDGRIKPDLVTRGVNVYGARAGTYNQYSIANGTSAATPIASGIAALLLSVQPHLTNNQIRNIFFETSDQSSNPNNERGYGLMSALKAIEFPNLEYKNGSYILHKIILEPENIVPQTLTVHYSTDGENYIEHQLNFDNNLTYTFEFPYLINGDLVDFYFTYTDSNNVYYTEPQSTSYVFYAGQLNISLNLNPKEYVSYIVSNPYPNPFLPNRFGFSRVSIRSSGGEKIKITIIDPTGQKIKEINAISENGESHYDWDGKSDSGIPVASGVYFFLIEKNGEEFGRKLVLLK